MSVQINLQQHAGVKYIMLKGKNVSGAEQTNEEMTCIYVWHWRY